MHGTQSRRLSWFPHDRACRLLTKVTEATVQAVGEMELLIGIP